MSIAAVVADANVLLSAALGHAASRVFTEFAVEVHACDFNCAEVESYLPALSKKYRLPAEIVALQWRLLPVQRHADAEYGTALAAARAGLAATDPDDAHPLALAQVLTLPLWSNDDDLARTRVRRYTTAELLAALARQRRP